MTTIEARVAQARDQLRHAGIAAAEADLDARLLAQKLLGWDTTRLLTDGNEGAPSDFLEKYEALVGRRVRREPLAYITGQKEFWGLSFLVSPAVLIPRPETELIVEAALERCADEAVSIADVCTGSGCLAIAIAHERRWAEVIATDISADALDVARRNAVRHGVAGRVRFVQADLLQSVEPSFDLIVSNPPYVLQGDRPALSPEVRDHEPALALFAGDDGLSVIRRLIGQAVPRLKVRGVLMFEFGYGQPDLVEKLLADERELELIEFKQDLQGILRIAIAKRL